jgi:hypothetical protein
LILTAILSHQAVRAADPPLKPKTAPRKEKAPAKSSDELTEKWTVLVAPNKGASGIKPLPTKGKLTNYGDLSLTGPKPGHPFVMGDFDVDGDFSLVNGGLERTSGSNAAVLLPKADQFELEGMMEQIEFGGWFVLVGWEDGRGYLLSNPTMKESGSPWFFSELRGGVAIPEGTNQHPDLEWLKLQPFKLTVAEKKFTMEVGKRKVLDGLEMENYAPGRVVLGVYNTRYGPKKIRINSLRMRARKDVPVDDAPEIPVDDAPEAEEADQAALK